MFKPFDKTQLGAASLLALVMAQPLAAQDAAPAEATAPDAPAAEAPAAPADGAADPMQRPGNDDTTPSAGETISPARTGVNRSGSRKK